MADVLGEALTHAEEPEFGGRAAFRALEEELWSLNRALIQLPRDERSSVATAIVRGAVRTALSRQPECDETRRRAWSRMFRAIEDESTFERGRVLAEVSEPDLARAEVHHRRALWVIGTMIGLAEIGMLITNGLAGSIAALPVIGLLTVVGIEATPGRAVLTQNYVYPALRECEAMFVAAPIEPARQP